MVSSFIEGNIDFIDNIVNHQRMIKALTQSDLFPIGDFQILMKDSSSKFTNLNLEFLK